MGKFSPPILMKACVVAVAFCQFAFVSSPPDPWLISINWRLMWGWADSGNMTLKLCFSAWSCKNHLAVKKHYHPRYYWLGWLEFSGLSCSLDIITSLKSTFLFNNRTVPFNRTQWKTSVQMAYNEDHFDVVELILVSIWILNMWMEWLYKCM